jgi:DNA topoisomerase-3
LTNYAALTQPLLEKRLKSPKVFNDKKSYGSPCDYSNGDSAICNTISSKYMIVLQSDLLPFYDDCLVANTTVVGKLPIFYSKPLEKKS